MYTKKTAFERVRITPEIYKSFSDELKNNKNLTKEAIRLDPSNIKYVPQILLNDEDIIELSLRKRGSSLKYFSEEVRTNKDFIRKAMKSSGAEILEYVPLSIISDEDFMAEMMNIDASTYNYMNKDLQNNLSFFIKNVSKHLTNKVNIQINDDFATKENIMYISKINPAFLNFLSNKHFDYFDEKELKVLFDRNMSVIYAIDNRPLKSNDLILFILKKSIFFYDQIYPNIELTRDLAFGIKEIIENLNNEEIKKSFNDFYKELAVFEREDALREKFENQKNESEQNKTHIVKKKV